MTVRAVDNSNQNRTCLVPMLKGGVLGSAVGYALKYTYPLNDDEKNTREYRMAIEDINRKKNTYSSWTQSYLEIIDKKKNKSVAEDVFVKAYSGMKDGDVLDDVRVNRAFTEIEKIKPDEKQQLKMLFSNVTEQAEKMAARHIEICNMATKYIRPTAFFVGVGAVVGAIVALAHEVLRTDIKEQ